MGRGEGGLWRGLLRRLEGSEVLVGSFAVVIVILPPAVDGLLSWLVPLADAKV